MSGFSLKPQGQRENTNYANAPKIDYNAVNAQVEEDNQPAIISLIVDLGVHLPDLNVTDAGKDKTEFETKTEAEAFISQITEIKGKKEADKYKLTEVDGKFVVDGKLYQPKERQEVAIFADLVDSVVDYGDEIGQKPYRILINKSFNGNIRGISTKPVPPQSGNVWTFAGNSTLTKLANATKQKTIIDGTVAKDLNDIGLLLGKSIMADIEKNVNGEKVYINLKGVGSVPTKIEKTADYTLVQPVGIAFDTVTVEDLENAKLRGNIFKKIKAATNYKGSRMEAVINEYEAKHGGGSNDDSSNGSGDHSDDASNGASDDNAQW